MQPEWRIVDHRNDNGMGSKKEKLERALRLSIKEADDDDILTSSSPCCPKVLEALHTFLTQWDVLEEEGIYTQKEDKSGAKPARDLPCDYLKLVLCRMLSNLDPFEYVDIVREQMLSTLRDLQTTACRQVVFDFLPAVTRIFAGRNSYNSVWSEGQSRRAKKQIFSCLKEVFENEPNSLSQILQFFSSILAEVPPRKHVISSRDVYLFVIEILPKVPEPNLHLAIRALIQYVNGTEDARLAVDSVRTELALLEKTDISDMTPVATAFDEAVRGTNKNEDLYVEEYFVVLEELVDERKKKRYRSRHDGVHQVNDAEKQLLTFDLVMMIMLKDSIMYRDRILGMISDGSLLESGLLSDEHISRLVELANGGQTCISKTAKISVQFESNPRLNLLEALAAFSMSILLTPLHSAVEFDTEKFFSQVQVLLIRVILKLPKDFQTRAISMALRIVHDLMKGTENAITENTSKDRLQKVAKIRSRICVNIFLLLLSLVSRRREILMSFQNHLVEYLMSESFDYLQKIDLLQALCTVVAKVFCNNNSNGPLDSIVICRTLLFSPPRVSTTTSPPQIQAELLCRQIRGMMFANSIISCCDLDVTLLVTMQKMVSRVLLSPHSNVVLLDPRIGLHGMKLLRHLREQIKSDHSLGKSLFQVASLVLSHSRIIHYPDDFSERSTTKSDSILAYNVMSSFFPFSNQTVKQSRFRKMIFRFDSFFANETLLAQSSSWERYSLWIFELINTYLTLGRTAKWNPRAWIFAGIEFPGVSSSTLITVRRKEKLSNWMKSSFCSFGCSQDNRISASRMDKHILELIKSAKTTSEKEAIVNSISRFTLSSLFALSSSIAVLCNTYNHFKDFLDQKHDKMDCNKKNEALQMMHYQFTKIYDLEQVCQSMERLFRNLGSRSHNAHKRSKKLKKRKLNKSSLVTEKTVRHMLEFVLAYCEDFTHLTEFHNFTLKKIQIKAEMVSLNLREALTRLLYSTEFIPKKVFWHCLTDPSHDAIIISAVKNLEHNETIKPISEVVQLRLNLIKHLATITPHAAPVEHNSTQVVPEESASIFRRDIVRCLRLTSFLLLNFPLLKRTTECDELIESFIKLISEYLRLVCTILITKMHDGQTSETNNGDFFFIFWLFLSIVGSKNPLSHNYGSKTTRDSFNVKDFKILVASFQDHIGDHHNSITSQLLETLSVFAARSGSSILECTIDVHWNATFLSEYTNGEKYKNISSSPFVLVELLKSLSPYNSQGCTNTTNEECCPHQTITKLMNHRYNKSLERHQYLIYSMCRHWGLLALSRRRIQLIASFLNTLLGKLVEYLRDVDDCLVGQTIDSLDNEALSNDDDDDGEYLPPSTSTSLVYKPSIPTFCDFVCLTSYSYPVYLDMLMRMTVSSIALFSIPEEMSSFKQHATTSCRLHPVHELERMAVVYGSLVKLYKDKFHIFPKCLQSSIISISKCMLDVSVTKSQEYIEWRNCQPVLLVDEGEFKGPDLASTAFLKKLLDTFGLHVIGTLRTFCCVHSGSTTIQGRRLTQLQKGNQLVLGNFVMPGHRLLARKTERTFEFLSQTSKRYSTGEIKTDNIVQHAQQREHKASTKGLGFRPEFLSKTEQSSIMEDSLYRGVGQESEIEIESKTDSSSIRKRGSHRSTPTPSVGNYDASYSDDGESFSEQDDESSSTNNAFGVSGDWGQHIEDSDKESDAEFFIDRFHKSR